MTRWTLADIDAYERRKAAGKARDIAQTGDEAKPESEATLEPIKEHRFHAKRKWRFDYAWPSKMIALEVEGGAWSGGRHTRGAGFIADMEKYNEAALLGWRVFRCVPGDEAGWIERINGMEGRK